MVWADVKLRQGPVDTEPTLGQTDSSLQTCGLAVAFKLVGEPKNRLGPVAYTTLIQSRFHCFLDCGYIRLNTRTRTVALTNPEVMDWLI